MQTDSSNQHIYGLCLFLQRGKVNVAQSCGKGIDPRKIRLRVGTFLTHVLMMHEKHVCE